MKQKRHTTEEIIRILREADAGKDLEAVLRKHNVSAASFYRWKKKFGGMELKDARKYRQLAKENSGLKQLLADSLLKIRVLEEVNAKKGRPFAEAASGPGRGASRTLLGAKGVPVSGAASFQPPSHPQAALGLVVAAAYPDRSALPPAPAPGLPQARAPAAP